MHHVVLVSLLAVALACTDRSREATSEGASAPVTVAPPAPPPAPAEEPSGPGPAPTPLPAAPDDAKPKPSEFLAPTYDFACIFTPAGGSANYKPESGGPELKCDSIRAKKYARVILGPAGPARLFSNSGDAGCCAADHVLSDGEVWIMAPFRCQLSEKVLRCTRDDGRGFAIERGGIRAIALPAIVTPAGQGRRSRKAVTRNQVKTVYDGAEPLSSPRAPL